MFSRVYLLKITFTAWIQEMKLWEKKRLLNGVEVYFNFMRFLLFTSIVFFDRIFPVNIT